MLIHWVRPGGLVYWGGGYGDLGAQQVCGAIFLNFASATPAEKSPCEVKTFFYRSCP